MSKAELLANKQYLYQAINRDLFRRRMKELNILERSRKRDLKVTFVSESETVRMYAEESQVNDDSNVHVLGTVQVQNDMSPVNLSQVGVPNAYPLNDFWERKVKIAEFEISPTTTQEAHQFIINPFQLWSSDTSVRAKLYNYVRAKFDLKVSVTLSGSRYLGGSFLVSNQPFSTMNNCCQKAQDDFTGVFGESNVRSNCYMSQSPETRIILIGEEDNDFEILLPFIGPAPMMNLFNVATTPGPTEPFEQSIQLSTLYFQTITPLIDYSEQYGETVAIVVYASAHNMDLQSLTATELIVNESEQIDLSKNPISGVADMVTKVSDVFSKVPVIGDFADKVSRVASRVGKFARAFGFSKPSDATPEHRVVPKGYSLMTNVEGIDPSAKMTLFPNQEVSLMSMTTENQIDEMSYAHMCKLESYLFSFPWLNSDAPNTANLALFPVTPMLVAGASRAEVQHTPMSYLGLAHKYWRGSVTFRFEVVAPVAARGQLAFWFEPNIIDIAALAALDLDLNKNPIAILNIEQARTVTIKCGFNSSRPVNRTSVPTPSFPKYYDVANVIQADAYNPNFSGFLGVTPFTRLQPSSSFPIYINVYVSSDDMHFYEPSYTRNIDEFLFQSIETFVSESHTKEFSYDIKGKTVDLYGCVSSMDTTKYIFGEEPLSLRSILKRYTRIFESTTAPMASTVHFMYPPFPRVTGILQWAAYQQSGPLASIAGANSPIPSVFNHFRRAYLFMRGGYRWKLACAPGVCSIRTVVRNNNDLMNVVNDVVTNKDFGGAEQLFNTNIGGVEYEIPYFTSNLVYPANNISELQGGNLFNDVDSTAYGFNFLQTPSSHTAILYGAAADDFSFVRYQGAPCMNLQA